jgi:hypothetical protein
MAKTFRARLIALACTRAPSMPEGVRRERWTHRELAGMMRMSESQPHLILPGAGVRPHLTQSWVMSELGPDSEADPAVICGVYLDLPAKAIALSIDQKTSIAGRRPAPPVGAHSPVVRRAATASTCAMARGTSPPRCRCMRAPSTA